MQDHFEKVKAYKNRMLEEPIRLDVENLKFLLAVYQDHAGQPDIIKRARYFERLCDEKTIYIDENPIVGTMANSPTAVCATPEFKTRWIRREIKQGFKVGLGAVAALPEEDMKILTQALDYWEDKGVYTRGQQTYDEIYAGEATILDQIKTGAWAYPIADFHLGFVILDFAKALEVGFEGIISEIGEEMAKLPVGLLENRDKRYFYQAAVICLRAMIRLAGRYADLATEMAATEQNTERKQELLGIADVCRQVPAQPARNFHEACQSFWFTFLGAQMETPNAGALSVGRFPLYMHPFYKQDKDQGNIKEEDAITLLGWVFLRIQGYGVFQPGENYNAQQGQTAMHLSIGGLTETGEDATNELDYLVVETQRRLRLTEPSLTLMWHDQLPEDFLLKCVDLIRTGIGQPQFLNNERAIERSLYHFPGLSLAEARSVANVACVPTRPSHCCSNFWGGPTNMGKVLELALNNGKDPLTGTQIGPETGNADEFETFDQFLTALDRQMAHRIDRHLSANNISFSILAEKMPLPYSSCFIDDCIKRGKDIQNDGAKYSTNFLLPVGMVDVGNSLAAIKKLVYEDKKLTMKELKAALEADFEGSRNEEIRRMCLESPKYGNDDSYVDSLVKHCYDFFVQEHTTHTDPFGNMAHPEAYSVTVHNFCGMYCGATPDGRKARTTFTDATVSATPGTDRKGPTALARSAAKVVDTMEYGSSHLNMKFHPTAIAEVEGARNLIALVKTYMDWGGHHIQFNCVSMETLKAAQEKPESYKDLVIRVAGFSAYFIHLDKAVQDEIIQRTELRFI